MGSTAVSRADQIDKGNKVSRSYTPLSFYMDSAVNHPGPVRKGNNKFSESEMNKFFKENSIPLSFYTRTLIYFPAPRPTYESLMYIFVPKEEKVSHQLSYYMDPTLSHPARKTYCPFSTSKSVAKVTRSQSSGSMGTVRFGSIVFRSSKLKSSESKVSFGWSSELKSSESKVSFGSQSLSESKASVGSQSSETKSSRSVGFQSSETKSSRSVGSQSSESKSSESTLSFHSIGSQSSQSKSSESKFIFGSSKSKSSESKFIFGSFGSQSSESKSVAKVSKNCIPLSTAAPSSKSKVGRNSIPDIVAFSILSKLSIQSLKRFGCGCKSWSLLFENPTFMTMYTKHFISRHACHDDYHTFILTNHHLGHRLFHSEFHFLHNRLKLNLPSPLQRPGYYTCILGSTSVNGIFCLGQNIQRRDSQAQYVLWNPLTQEFMLIPSSPAELTPKHHRGSTVYLGHLFHGFGYDQLRRDFKVVQYVSFISRLYPHLTTSFFEIYSLNNKSWTMIDMDNSLSHWAYTQCMSFNGLEVYLNGACHWLVSDCINHRHAMTLLSFDLTMEVFLTTPIGEEPYNPYSGLGRLTVLNGSIALISNYHDDLVFQISILGELGVSESWIKLYTYGPLPSIQWPPIGFGKMGPIFFKKKDYEVVYVDLSTQIIEEVGITCGKTNYNIGGLYKESLLSLKDHVTRSLQGKPSFVGGSCN